MNDQLSCFSRSSIKFKKKKYNTGFKRKDGFQNIEPTINFFSGVHGLESGLMKDHGQQARASENFAGPVDFETPRPDLPVHF